MKLHLSRRYDDDQPANPGPTEPRPHRALHGRVRHGLRGDARRGDARPRRRRPLRVGFRRGSAGDGQRAGAGGRWPAADLPHDQVRPPARAPQHDDRVRAGQPASGARRRLPGVPGRAASRRRRSRPVHRGRHRHRDLGRAARAGRPRHGRRHHRIRDGERCGPSRRHAARTGGRLAGLLRRGRRDRRARSRGRRPRPPVTADTSPTAGRWVRPGMRSRPACSRSSPSPCSSSPGSSRP